MRHFVGQIPGRPAAQVVNMQGGGGIVMSNWAYNVAPRDGTVLGMPNLSMVMDQVISPTTVKYDAARFNWIGNIEPQEMSVFTWHTSPTKTIEDAMRRETVMAASTKGSPLQQIMTISNITLGTKFRIVLGYLDTRVLAVERGEVEGSASSIQNFAVLAPQWLENDAKSLNVLAVNAPKRSPKFPNAPTMIELAKTPEHRDMLEFMMLQGLTGRSIFGPPDVPQERIAILRTAFDSTMRDPAFLEEMRKLKVEVDWTPGPEVAASVRRVIGASPETAARVLKAIE
jgi:tripartite-type tricarboxylate transporter receptor subunit TctC